MDIMGGQVVRAAGGVRAEYKPISSPLLSSPDPAHFVHVIQQRFNAAVFYIADLDAIMGRKPNLKVIDALLKQTNARFWVDGGYRRLADAPTERERIVPVIATETYMEWNRAPELSGVVASIDTNHRRFICSRAGMPLKMTLDYFRQAGTKDFIHMRLDAVGAGYFDPFRLIPPRPGERWYAAGGVRDEADLSAATEAGYTGALVSTALLSGKLTPQELAPDR
ncbi:MAG: HisA/HisF-related TIM barrel protein [Nitrospinota bacterium]|nr:HisA/HisF-related TIM barrel protein [Nitrospinota bacterium]MDH5756403.1 HisA/HisF-related TIM barrel protein [Nitrospinota bacterium]